MQHKKPEESKGSQEVHTLVNETDIGLEFACNERGVATATGTRPFKLVLKDGRMNVVENNEEVLKKDGFWVKFAIGTWVFIMITTLCAGWNKAHPMTMASLANTCIIAGIGTFVVLLINLPNAPGGSELPMTIELGHVHLDTIKNHGNANVCFNHSHGLLATHLHVENLGRGRVCVHHGRFCSVSVDNSGMSGRVLFVAANIAQAHLRARSLFGHISMGTVSEFADAKSSWLSTIELVAAPAARVHQNSRWVVVKDKISH